VGAAGELGAGDELPPFLPGIGRGGVRTAPIFFGYSHGDFVGAHLSFWDRPGPTANGSL